MSKAEELFSEIEEQETRLMQTRIAERKLGITRKLFNEWLSRYPDGLALYSDMLKAENQIKGQPIAKTIKMAKNARVKRGTLVPESTLGFEVLRYLNEHPEGADTAKNIMDAVGQRLSGLFSPEDHTILISNGQVRWRNRTQWARQRHIDAKRLESRKDGVWAITQLGRDFVLASMQ
jgi:hypothetical protein